MSRRLCCLFFAVSLFFVPIQTHAQTQNEPTNSSPTSSPLGIPIIEIIPPTQASIEELNGHLDGTERISVTIPSMFNAHLDIILNHPLIPPPAKKICIDPHPFTDTNK